MKLRAGVFGCGPQGLWSAARLASQNDCELAAAGDDDADRRAAFGATTGVTLLCATFEELLATGIDIAILAGPRSDRLARVRLAAGQGVHCLVHAPMARSAADAAAMQAICEEFQVQLGVLVPQQGDPVFEQLRQMIVADWLGGIVHVQCLAGDDDLLRNAPIVDDPRLQAQIADNPLLQLASHHVHLTAWLTGRAPTSVTAQASRGFLPLPADSAVATALLRGGVTCTFAASHLLRAEQFAIHGTDGFVRLAGDRIVLCGQTEFRGVVFDYLEPGRELALVRGDLTEALEREIQGVELHGRFARTIDDRDDFPCSGEQAATDLLLLEAMARAMTSGRAETV